MDSERAESRYKNVLVAFLQHGMDGSAADFAHFARSLEAQFRTLAPSDKAFVWTSNANKGSTSDGIKIMAQRSAAEFANLWKTDLTPWLEDTCAVGFRARVHLALVGHSIGGLILRCAAGLLFFGDGEEQAILPQLSAKFDQDIEIVPLSFVTISSPHLGVRRPNAVPGPSGNQGSPSSVDVYTRVLGAAARPIAQLRMGLSGKELLLSDGPEDPMMMKLCKPPFSDVLARFPCRTVVASTVNDIVPHSSAAIRSNNPYVKLSEYRVRFEKQGLEVSAWSGFDGASAKIYAENLENVLGWADKAQLAAFAEALPEQVRPKHSQHYFPLPDMEIDQVGTRHYLSEPLPMPIMRKPPKDHRRAVSAVTVSLGRIRVFGTKSADNGTTSLQEEPMMESVEVRETELIASKTTINATKSISSDGSSTILERSASAPPDGDDSSTGSGQAPRELTTDTPPSLLFPPSLLLAAQSCYATPPGSFRRISLTLNMTKHPALFALQTHPMMIGKTVGGVPRDVVEIGWRAADLVARVIVVDFLLCR